jgi:A/G-specific adenine glycosylase
LWSFPECPLEVDVADWCQERLNLTVTVESSRGTLRHSFSHFHLEMTPVPATVFGQDRVVMEGDRFVWYNSRNMIATGQWPPRSSDCWRIWQANCRTHGNQRWLEW